MGFMALLAIRQPAIQSSRTRSDSYTNSTNAGTATSIADLSGYELANNPDGGDVVSKPYALAIKDDTAMSLMVNTL